MSFSDHITIQEYEDSVLEIKFVETPETHEDGG